MPPHRNRLNIYQILTGVEGDTLIYVGGDIPSRTRDISGYTSKLRSQYLRYYITLPNDLTSNFINL